MQSRRRRSVALRIMEWLAYIVGGFSIIAISTWGLRHLLAATGVSVYWQVMIEKLFVASVACVVLLIVVLPDLLSQLRRMRKRR